MTTTEIADETVPSLPEMWTAARGGQLLTGASFAEVRPDSSAVAQKMRCPDCGMWFGGSTEGRIRAAVKRHRSGEECRVKWSYRQLLWDGMVPLTVGGSKARDEMRAALGATRGPGSYAPGGRGRKSSTATRDWAPYARVLKWESIKGDKSKTVEAAQDCAEFERIATERTRALALKPWSTAEEIRTALAALAE